MFNRLSEVVRGERNLAETYWLWFILPQVPIVLLILIIASFSLAIVSYSKNLYFSLLYGALILGFLIALVAGFGVFQSAFKSSKSRFWSVVAVLIVSGNIIYGGIRIPGLLLGTAQPSALEMKQQMLMLNAQLPRKIDAVTTLAHIEMEGTTLTYSFVLDESVAQRVEGTTMRALARPNICKIFEISFEQKLLSKVVYAYSSGADKLFQFEVRPSDCG